MKEKRIQCMIITPMFSYGAYNRWEPELRTSELKGAMRYVYRMICPAQLKELAKDEADLFGGAAGVRRSEEGHASPVRLEMRGDVSRDRGTLLLHKPQSNKNNPDMKYFGRGSFEVVVRLNSCIERHAVLGKQVIDLNWYADFIELTLMICGMGRRSRKGRGKVSVEGRKFESEDQILEWLCAALNRFATASSFQMHEPYKRNGNEITACCNLKKINHPVLQRVRIGKRLDSRDIERYLKTLDLAGHEAKDEKLSEEQRISTGSGRSRLASPLIISFLRTSNGYFPIYIFVKGLRNQMLIDSNFEYRELFISRVEEIMRGGTGR